MNKTQLIDALAARYEGNRKAGCARARVGARHHHPRGRQGREGRHHRLRLLREAGPRRPLGAQPAHRRADQGQEDGGAEVQRRRGPQGRRLRRQEAAEADASPRRRPPAGQDRRRPPAKKARRRPRRPPAKKATGQEGRGEEGAGQEGRGQEGAGRQEDGGQEGAAPAKTTAEKTPPPRRRRPRRRRRRRPPPRRRAAKKAPAKKAAAKKATPPKKTTAKKTPPRSPDATRARERARGDPTGRRRSRSAAGRSGAGGATALAVCAADARADARPRRSAAVVDVAAQRGAASPRDRRRRPRPRARRAEPAPKCGSKLVPGAGGVAASCPCPRRPRRTHACVGRPGASAASRSSAPQAGQVGAQRHRPRGRASAGAPRRRPGAGRALRSPATPSGITSHPRSRSPTAKRGVVGHHQHLGDRPGAPGGAATVSRANAVARARRASSARPTSRDLAERGRLHRHERAANVMRTSPRSCQAVAHDAAVRGRPPSAACRVRAVGRERRTARRSTVAKVAQAAAEARAGRSRPLRRHPQADRCWRTTKRDWIDGEKIPADRRLRRGRQPLSHARPADARALRLRPRPAAALPRQGRAVRDTGRSATSCAAPGQIPVDRLSQRRRRVRSTPRSRRCEQGECVVVYPEGTITRDPDLWPMSGKTGAARIALATGVPGDPGRRSGARRTSCAPYAKRPHLFPRKTDHVKAGDPVDLDDLRGPAADRRGAAARRPTGSWPRSPRWSRSSAASRRPPSGSTRARPGVTRDRQPARKTTPGEGDAHEQGRGLRRRLVGHGVLDRARRRRQRRHVCGRGARSCAPRSTSKRENTDYLPGIELPADDHARRTTRSRRWPAPTSSCSPCRRRRCARTSSDWAPVHRRTDAVLVSLMKGVELGTLSG